MGQPDEWLTMDFRMGGAFTLDRVTRQGDSISPYPAIRGSFHSTEELQ